MSPRKTSNKKSLFNALDSDVDRSRVLGIDPSSNSIAYTLIVDGQPAKYGKIIFYRKSDLPDKLRMLKRMIDLILEETDPTYVVVEQMIMVQNPQTTRILSYIAGAIEYEVACRGIPVGDIAPMTWKSFHGHVNVTKKLIAMNGWTTKEANHYRKSQIQDKIADRWNWFNYSDSDIADSCGIALWAAKVSMK